MVLHVSLLYSIAKMSRRSFSIRRLFCLAIPLCAVASVEEVKVLEDPLNQISASYRLPGSYGWEKKILKSAKVPANKYIFVNQYCKDSTATAFACSCSSNNRNIFAHSWYSAQPTNKGSGRRACRCIFQSYSPNTETARLYTQAMCLK